jgi:glucose-1-phosphate adenylyltransferase
MVSGGCIISGSRVSESVIFSNARIHSYSDVRSSVILPDVEIGRSVIMRNAIIDRGCRVPEGLHVGVNPEQDHDNGFRVTSSGVVLVTRGMLGQAEGSA